MIQAKAGEIEQQIAALLSLHQELNTLLNSWKDCGGHKLSPG
jgi:hypothetical protein